MMKAGNGNRFYPHIFRSTGCTWKVRSTKLVDELLQNVLGGAGALAIRVAK